MIQLILFLVTFGYTHFHAECCLKINTVVEGNGYIVAFLSTPTTKESISFNASLHDLFNKKKETFLGKFCPLKLGIIIFNVCSRETTSQAIISSVLDSRFVDNKTGESIILLYRSYLPKKYNEILQKFSFSEEITLYTPNEIFVTQNKSVKKDAFVGFNYAFVLNTFITKLKWQNVALLHIYNTDSYLSVKGEVRLFQIPHYLSPL